MSGGDDNHDLRSFAAGNNIGCFLMLHRFPFLQNRDSGSLAKFETFKGIDSSYILAFHKGLPYLTSRNYFSSEISYSSSDSYQGTDSRLTNSFSFWYKGTVIHNYYFWGLDPALLHSLNCKCYAWLSLPSSVDTLSTHYWAFPSPFYGHSVRTVLELLTFPSQSKFNLNKVRT